MTITCFFLVTWLPFPATSLLRSHLIVKSTQELSQTWFSQQHNHFSHTDGKHPIEHKSRLTLTLEIGDEVVVVGHVCGFFLSINFEHEYNLTKYCTFNIKHNFAVENSTEKAEFKTLRNQDLFTYKLWRALKRAEQEISSWEL